MIRLILQVSMLSLYVDDNNRYSYSVYFPGNLRTRVLKYNVLRVPSIVGRASPSIRVKLCNNNELCKTNKTKLTLTVRKIKNVCSIEYGPSITISADRNYNKYFGWSKYL